MGRRHPYPGALELRRVFARSRMVTEPGGNHGVSLAGNACVDRHLAAYLRDGVVPGPARRAPSGPDARCATTPAPQPAEPVRQAARMPASPGLGR
nr:hypothetical protein GCM10020093_101250 [Planobispora longispora]